MEEKKYGAISQKTIARKAAAKRATSIPKVSAKKAITNKVPAGYGQTGSGIIVPSGNLKPVPATKLQRGFKKAKDEIKKMIQEIAEIMTEDYKISEIQLSASFNAKGEFIGIGVGGSTTITLKITPV